MVKHNNAISKNHYPKDWQRYTKTWFDQPGKAKARRAKRIAKAARVAPRPVYALRPVVRCQTQKYNRKVRAGRGFTLEELRAAKISPLQAPGLGIAVDHRRKNWSERSFSINVQRLKEYMRKVVVLPRTKKQKEAAKDKPQPALLEKPPRVILPIVDKKAAVVTPLLSFQTLDEAKKGLAARGIKQSAYMTVRRAAVLAKVWPQIDKKLKERAEAKAAANKKAAKAAMNA